MLMVRTACLACDSFFLNLFLILFAEDFLTMRLLNIAGLSVAIKPAGFQLDVLRYLNTDYTMGVFLDIRCANQNVSGIFYEVRLNPA